MAPRIPKIDWEEKRVEKEERKIMRRRYVIPNDFHSLSDEVGPSLWILLAMAPIFLVFIIVMLAKFIAVTFFGWQDPAWPQNWPQN